MVTQPTSEDDDARRLREEGTLRCEACNALYPVSAPGRLVTADGCEICPACAPDLLAEDEDGER